MKTLRSRKGTSFPKVTGELGGHLLPPPAPELLPFFSQGHSWGRKGLCPRTPPTAGLRAWGHPPLSEPSHLGEVRCQDVGHSCLHVDRIICPFPGSYF